MQLVYCVIYFGGFLFFLFGRKVKMMRAGDWIRGSLVESFNLIVPLAVCVGVPNKSMAALEKKKDKSLEASQSNPHYQVWHHHIEKHVFMPYRSKV